MMSPRMLSLLRSITGSRVHRFMECPSSVVLPQNTNDDREARSEPARNKGKGVHEFLETVKSDGLDLALGKISLAESEGRVPEGTVLLCKALDIDNLPTNLATEVAYVWNWKERTARELGRNLDSRDYDRLGVDWSCEIPLTLDVVGWAELAGARRAYVGDYKTGHTRYPRPGKYGQIMLGLLCVTSVMGCSDGVGELLYLDEDGQCFPSRDTVDDWDLSIFADELEERMKMLPELNAEFEARGGGGIVKHEGAHCRYCPGFQDCTAKTALVRAVPPELIKLGVKRLEDGELAHGPVHIRNAAQVWEACERIEDICKRMRAEVTGIAYIEPVELSDGRVIERRTTKRRSVDGKVAAAVLEEKYGREEAMKAISVHVSIDAIRDRIIENIDPKVKPRPKIQTTKEDGLLDLIFKEIERRGGLSVDTTETCKPHQPKKTPTKKLAGSKAGT